MATIEKKNWVSRVLGVLNMTEDGHIAAFHSLAVSSINKAVRELTKQADRIKEDHKDWLEREKEILSEKRDRLAEVAITVDKEELTTREARERYFEVYISNIKRAKDVVAVQEKRIKDQEDNVKRSIEEIEAKIALQKEILAHLSN